MVKGKAKGSHTFVWESPRKKSHTPISTERSLSAPSESISISSDRGLVLLAGHALFSGCLLFIAGPVGASLDSKTCRVNPKDLIQVAPRNV